MNSSKPRNFILALGSVCALTITGSVSAYFLYFLPQTQQIQLQQAQSQLEFEKHEADSQEAEKSRQDQINRNIALSKYKDECLNTLQADRDKATKDLQDATDRFCVGTYDQQLACAQKLYNTMYPKDLPVGKIAQEAYLDNCAQEKYNQIYGF